MFEKVRQLFGNLVIYGLGDAATSVISFFLLPLYTRYLSPRDYGVITLLITVEAVTKILFRWGVDGAFMRLYYDCRNREDRQRLASTIAAFLFLVNGALLLVGLLGARRLGLILFGTRAQTELLQLVMINTFIANFYFIPFSVLRIENRAGIFTTLTALRSLATIVARLVLVVPFRMGVQGVVWADIVVTVGFSVLLARWYVPLLRPMLSRELLREALRYGLPRIPHSLAHQVIAVGDRYILSAFVTLREIGLYGVGATFGLALKLFLNGFEFAWAPFYFGAMNRPDAKETFAGLTTYVLGVVALLACGLSAIAPDLVRLMTTPQFQGASAVIPWIALSVVMQAMYQMTAIGLSITKQTKYFPIATGIAALVSVTSNLLLIPWLGFIGAAVSNTISYATLTTVSMYFSQRLYPIRYEWRRLGLIAGAGLGAYVVTVSLVPPDWPPFWGFLARGTMVVVLYPAALYANGFFRPTELQRLFALRSMLSRTRVVEQVEQTEMGGEIVDGDLVDLSIEAPGPERGGVPPPRR